MINGWSTMEGLKEKFLKWKSALESKGLKVNLEKKKVMVCGSEGKAIQSKIDPCRIFGKKVTINSVLCTKCDQWIHEKYSNLKKVTPSSARFFVCSKSEKATNGAGEEQQKVMCDKSENCEGISLSWQLVECQWMM